MRLTQAQYNGLKPRPKKAETGMNKTEARYAARLELSRQAGEIIAWAYEPLTFRLGDNLHYKPDFLVITDEMEIHEVKGGYVREDAIVKFKAAKEKFPWFSWRMMQWKGKVWTQIR